MQVIDTVDLYHLQHQRKLSLRFLASYALRMDIQQETHDSIEDARAAVLLLEVYPAPLRAPSCPTPYSCGTSRWRGALIMDKVVEPAKCATCSMAMLFTTLSGVEGGTPDFTAIGL